MNCVSTRVQRFRARGCRVATAASTTLTFTITYTSKLSGLTSSASANVRGNDLKSSGGGRGALDWVSVLALFGMLGVSLRYRREAQIIRYSRALGVTPEERRIAEIRTVFYP
jgi:hypothetical protein